MIRFSTRVGRHSWVSLPLWLALWLLPLYWGLLILELELRAMWWLTASTVTLTARLLRAGDRWLTARRVAQPGH